MRIALAVLLAAGAGCSNVSVLVNQGRLTLRIAVNPESLVLVIGGEARRVAVSLQRGEETGPVNLRLEGVPPGVTAEVEQPGITNTGTITFQATRDAEAQPDVAVTIIASDGQVFDLRDVTLMVVP